MVTNTHYSKFAGKTEGRTDFPSDPTVGQEFYHTTDDARYYWNGTAWLGEQYTTTTSTSSSTTTTSTSTTSTSTSTSTTTTSTSTTTTSTSTTTTV